MAAKYFDKAGQYHKALKLYKLGGELFLEQAIEMVGRVKIQELVDECIAWVMGETEGGVPLDPIYIYKIKVMSGKHKEAQKVAVTIAADYQEQSNYK